MDRHAIIKKLGLDQPLGPEAAADPLRPACSNIDEDTSRRSDYALRLDAWDKDRGRLLHDADPTYKALRLGAEEVADLHGAAFLYDPAVDPSARDPLRRLFLERLLQNPEFQAERGTTSGDCLRSEAAARALAERYRSFLEELQRIPDKILPPGRSHRRTVDRKPPPADPEKEKAELKDAVERTAARSAAGAARRVEKALVEVEDTLDLVGAEGWGPGTPAEAKLDLEKLTALFNRVKHSPLLRRISEQLGKFIAVAKSKQRQKVLHGVDEYVGVRPGGSVHRLVASERAKLAIPELEDDLLRRLADRQARCRDFRSVEKVGKGPIIVTVDSSGSMDGDKIETAKALAGGLAYLARQQKRWCALVDYSGDTGQKVLALPPGRWNEWGFLDWLETNFGGGSDLDIPIRELPAIYAELAAPAGRTDVLMITDALCDPSPELVEAFVAWKQSVQARVSVLVIDAGSGGDPSAIAALSDEYHIVPTIRPDSDFVGSILSI